MAKAEERKFTHEDLVQKACRWLKSAKSCGVVYAEAGRNVCWEEPDAIGWKTGGSTCIVVECKTSRSDFKADAKKPVARRAEHLGRMGTHRYYLVPEGLVKPEELPPHWGLLYAKPTGGVRLVVEAVQHPKRNLRDEMSWLYAVARRHHLGVVFFHDTHRFDVTEEAKKWREARAKKKAAKGH
jgi:hypothetical protein